MQMARKSPVRSIALALIGCAAALLCLFSQTVAARALYQINPDVNFTINSKAYYLYNVDTKTPICEVDSQTKRIPASTVKIMTCILALENTDNLDETFVFPQYVFNTLNGTGASHADVHPGEEMTMRKALYCLMLQSDCFSALAIADRIGGGDVDVFVDMMNEKAQEIGAINTHFTNPHGLILTADDSNMLTTPYDLCLMADYAMKLEGFMDYCSVPAMDISPTNVHTSNYLLTSTIESMKKLSPHYYEPIKGIKTGSLPECGYNLVTSATRDGYTYILVLMGADAYDEEGKKLKSADQPIFQDAKNILDWAFNGFSVRVLYKAGEEVAEVKVALGKDEDIVKVVAAEDFSALVPVEIQVEPDDGKTGIIKRPHLPQNGVEAPVVKDKVIGSMDIMLGGDVLGSVDLLAKKDIARSQSKYILSKISGAFDNFLLKFILILILVVVVFYVILTVLRNRYRKRYRRARGHRK